MDQRYTIEMLREALICVRSHGVTFDIFRDDIGKAVLQVADEALDKSEVYAVETPTLLQALKRAEKAMNICADEAAESGWDFGRGQGGTLDVVRDAIALVEGRSSSTIEGETAQ